MIGGLIMRYYAFHWFDGQIVYARGVSEADAATNAGICHGALSSIDFVEEVKELPMSEKEIRYISLDKKERTVGRGTILVDKALEQIENGRKNISFKIRDNLCKFKVKIEPFKIILIELA